MARVYCALIHHPVLDRAGAVVTTAVTNLDVHDIARSACTYGVAGYYVVSPITAQRLIVDRILEHWRVGPGATRIPERGDALELVEAADSLEAVAHAIETREGRAPRLAATSARTIPGRTPLAWAEAVREIASSAAPVLILFGTGHGLAPAVIAGAELLLPPIRPGAPFNHLSVRSAAAVVLDRLFGDG